MPPSRPLPTVVIVGRPNVGKSTLFNRITGQRRSIVGDEPGITRDRIEGLATHKGRLFQLIDTGGIVVHDADFIPAQILKQAKVALSRADHIIFLIDGRSDITGADRDLAQLLLKLGRPVTLVVNKMDTREREALANEFYVLGIRDLFPVSAEHALGIEPLLDHVVSSFPPADLENAKPAETPENRLIRVAIIGRPNTGKSTLLNAFTGAERSIVSPVAGTTRDAVDETVVRNGIEYVFVDTAGIRRKGKTTLMTEKLSVVMARRHIRMADVVLVVLDATEGVLALDATIAGYAHEGGRAIVICVNKWDTGPEKGKRKFEQKLRDQMKFMDYAPVAFISAKTGEGVNGLFKLIREVDDSASKRITTGELNRFVESLHFEDRKIFYVTQASIRPPAFVFFTNSTGPLHFSHERYLANQIRKRFGFRGAPVVVKTRTKRQK
ncbi:MAG TPA: ribosome biogenesis GTPase Der [Bryobacteraceae bacterium]|jgi:GTP-binding protein|nr:ribosome biogenesis GTPase Der [Bryobacteraceae bacterium]